MISLIPKLIAFFLKRAGQFQIWQSIDIDTDELSELVLIIPDYAIWLTKIDHTWEFEMIENIPKKMLEKKLNDKEMERMTEEFKGKY
jgi:hypothetical protein